MGLVNVFGLRTGLKAAIMKSNFKTFKDRMKLCTLVDIIMDTTTDSDGLSKKLVGLGMKEGRIAPLVVAIKKAQVSGFSEQIVFDLLEEANMPDDIKSIIVTAMSGAQELAAKEDSKKLIESEEESPQEIVMPEKKKGFFAFA